MFKWFWTIFSLGAPDQSDNRETNDKTKPFIHIIHDDKCLSCQNNSSFFIIERGMKWFTLSLHAQQLKKLKKQLKAIGYSASIRKKFSR